VALAHQAHWYSLAHHAIACNWRYAHITMGGNDVSTTRGLARGRGGHGWVRQQTELPLNPTQHFSQRA